MNRAIFKDKRLYILMIGLALLLLLVSWIIFWQKNNYDPSRYDEQITQADEAYDQMEYSIAYR